MRRRLWRVSLCRCGVRIDCTGGGSFVPRARELLDAESLGSPLLYAASTLVLASATVRRPGRRLAPPLQSPPVRSQVREHGPEGGEPSGAQRSRLLKCVVVPQRRRELARANHHTTLWKAVGGLFARLPSLFAVLCVGRRRFCGAGRRSTLDLDVGRYTPHPSWPVPGIARSIREVRSARHAWDPRGLRLTGGRARGVINGVARHSRRQGPPASGSKRALLLESLRS